MQSVKKEEDVCTAQDKGLIVFGPRLPYFLYSRRLAAFLRLSNTRPHWKLLLIIGMVSGKFRFNRTNDGEAAFLVPHQGAKHVHPTLKYSRAE